MSGGECPRLVISTYVFSGAGWFKRIQHFEVAGNNSNACFSPSGTNGLGILFSLVRISFIPPIFHRAHLPSTIPVSPVF
jgi:hypothetical protein